MSGRLLVRALSEAENAANVTSLEPLAQTRNGPHRVVTKWNKCLECNYSVHEHMGPNPWKLKREDARYCSNACRQRAYRKRKA